MRGRMRRSMARGIRPLLVELYVRYWHSATNGQSSNILLIITYIVGNVHFNVVTGRVRTGRNSRKWRAWRVIPPLILQYIQFILCCAVYAYSEGPVSLRPCSASLDKKSKPFCFPRHFTIPGSPSPLSISAGLPVVSIKPRYPLPRRRRKTWSMRRSVADRVRRCVRYCV